MKTTMTSSTLRLASSLPVGDPNRTRILKEAASLFEDEDLGTMTWKFSVGGITLSARRIVFADDDWEHYSNGVFLSILYGGQDLDMVMSKNEFEDFKKEMMLVLKKI